ncbi:MAG: four helix bundle protein [Rikenellaceae bacterium]|jgi:four helix bundle protein|nr:four helix bundle protein [Rikenellaceae bacterium]
MGSDNLIVRLSLAFAIDVVNYAEMLEANKKFVIAKQLLKSGTSIGANVREVQNAESLSDFLHKMKIAAKETEETDYWLLICDSMASYPDCNHLRSQLVDIRNVIAKIIISVKSKMAAK